MKSLYLDANAHLPLTGKAAKAYLDFSNSKAGHGHPSSLAQPGREAALALETARAKIAELIGADSANQIIFTSNCTQACEWAVKLLCKYDSETIAASPMEHPAVKDACAQNNIDQVLPCNKLGKVSSTSNSDIQNIICIHMQNEIGTIQDITKLKRNALFSDMSQSLGKIPVNVQDLQVDIAAFGAHKFGGPGGVGFLYLSDTDWWEPFGTGSRYFLDRPGTMDVAAIVATSVALEEALQTLPERTQKMQAFQSTLEAGLKQRSFEIVGEGAVRSPNTSFVSMPKIAMDTLMALGEYDIHVGLGSACGSMHAGKSPLMAVLGRSGGVHDYMRISQWGEYNDKDAELFLQKLDQVTHGKN